MFLFIDGPALVCGWVNFPILWPHTPVQTKLECPPGTCVYSYLSSVLDLPEGSSNTFKTREDISWYFKEGC